MHPEPLLTLVETHGINTRGTVPWRTMVVTSLRCCPCIYRPPPSRMKDLFFPFFSSSDSIKQLAPIPLSLQAVSEHLKKPNIGILLVVVNNAPTSPGQKNESRLRSVYRRNGTTLLAGSSIPASFTTFST